MIYLFNNGGFVEGEVTFNKDNKKIFSGRRFYKKPYILDWSLDGEIVIE